MYIYDDGEDEPCGRGICRVGDENGLLEEEKTRGADMVILLEEEE